MSTAPASPGKPPPKLLEQVAQKMRVLHYSRLVALVASTSAVAGKDVEVLDR